MGDVLNFYAVRKDGIGKLPEAARIFVTDFFQEGVVFGVPCYVAVGGEHKSPWSGMSDADYEKGLSRQQLESCGVFTALQENPEIVFHYSWS